MYRLLQPLYKSGGHYIAIDFEQAFQTVATQMSEAQANRTLFMASGDYSNEELYLLQRLARTSFNTNAIASFDYYRRGTAFCWDKNDIVPLAELYGSDAFFTLLNPSIDTPAQEPLLNILNSCPSTPRYNFNTPETLNIKDFGAFFRCVNRYLIENGLAKGIYVEGLGKDFGRYKDRLLADNLDMLLGANGLQEEDIRAFADHLRLFKAPVFLFWERYLDGRGVIELENLCMLLDIQAKPAAGFLCIKAELNSQGLFDMGISPHLCVGGNPFSETNTALMEKMYGGTAQTASVDVPARLVAKDFDACLLFNAGGGVIPDEVTTAARHCRFSVLHTAFIDDTATQKPLFDLLLPASLPSEVEGTYTDSGRVPHRHRASEDCPLPFTTTQMLSRISCGCGLRALEDTNDIFLEYISFFQGGCHSKNRHFFR